MPILQYKPNIRLLKKAGENILGFKQSDVERLLVECHRRCCVCHRYCGFRMEIDHLKPIADGGTDSYDNAIAVCFDCHAEIHHYNPKHPKGRRFTQDELKAHKDQWLKFCAENPAALAGTVPPAEGGALERLLSELMFNRYLIEANRPAALLEIAQFRRAISEGTFTWLNSEQVSVIHEVYALISEINNRAQGLTSVEHTGRRNELGNKIRKLLVEAYKAIIKALEKLQTD